ncbi:transporter [Sulfurimonas sp. SAG-AH-194-C21]|nr:transporter [Sulfurimonas sp. SAG-AH-194-C21]MDF1882446.1 transporter [Sulfurimonas sp. SAG-AH-194-C21]
MKFFRIFLLLSALITSLLSNNTAIIADRPGFSTGTYTVQPGSLNVEMGYNYSKDVQTIPLMVLRTGITSDFELDIMYDGWDIKHSDGEQYSITSDIVIGGKYRIYESSLYNITFMGLTTLPIGSENTFKVQSISPFLAILWDYTLSEQTSLFGTLQSTSYMQDTQRIYDAQLALGASFSHTDKFGSFIEIYTIIPSEKQIGTESVFDGGFTYMLNDDVQLDINMGLGLNAISQNFIGAGVALQF